MCRYVNFVLFSSFLRNFHLFLIRSFNLVFQRESTYKGIKVLDFHLPTNFFYNGTLNPDNEGFCNKNCLGNGVLNISTCNSGISIKEVSFFKDI